MMAQDMIWSDKQDAAGLVGGQKKPDTSTPVAGRVSGY